MTIVCDNMAGNRAGISCYENGIASSSSGGITSSTGTATIDCSKGTCYSSYPIQYPSAPIQQENKMDRCGVSINCTVPTYAYNGLDFVLHGIDLAVIILACTAAFYWYKKANKTFK